MATYHNNKKTKWSDSGIAYHDNGRIAFSSGIAYHDNGRIAFSSGIFYDSNGRIINNKSFSIGLGKGVTLEIISNIKITVYGRKIN